MKILGRDRFDAVIVVLSRWEIERLYDGLDADEEQLESFKESDEADLPQINRDIEECRKLTKDFQPLIEEIRKLKAGDQLPNGAIVLQEKNKIILAENNTGTRDEYVTWQWDGKDRRSTFYGHYHQTLAEAVADFEERVAKQGG